MVASDVSTKKQQFAREGPLHYVPVNMPDTELTLTILKNLISTKLNLVGPIDLLETERGPSIEAKSQLKRTKIIHVRCLDQCMSEVITRPPKFALPPKREVARPVVPCSSSSSQYQSIPKSVMKRKADDDVPSITPTKMLQLGQNIPIVPKSKSRCYPMSVWEFTITDNGEGVWGDHSIIGVSTGADIGEGGFRLAREAHIQNGEMEVIKTYVPKSIEDFARLGITPYEHARLSIQTQMNAHYICAKFSQKLSSLNVDAPLEFKYVKPRLGKYIAGPNRDQYCMLEPHMPGKL